MLPYGPGDDQRTVLSAGSATQLTPAKLCSDSAQRAAAGSTADTAGHAPDQAIDDAARTATACGHAAIAAASASPGCCAITSADAAGQPSAIPAAGRCTVTSADAVAAINHDAAASTDATTGQPSAVERAAWCADTVTIIVSQKCDIGVAATAI